jgi:hypothetical protein
MNIFNDETPEQLLEQGFMRERKQMYIADLRNQAIATGQPIPF